MGSFYTSLNIRTDNLAEVVRAAETSAILPAYVSCFSKGWVTLHPEQTEIQDPSLIKSFGDTLSKLLKVPVISFLVHDGDVFQYTLHAKGRTVDSYDSWPQYTKPNPKPKGGKAKLLIEYGGITAITEGELDAFLKKGGDAEYLAEKLAGYLQISGDQACEGYNRLLDIAESSGQFQFLKAPDTKVDATGIPCLITNTELMLLDYKDRTDPKDQEMLNMYLPPAQRTPIDGYFPTVAGKYGRDTLSVSESFQVFNIGNASKGITVSIKCDSDIALEGSVAIDGKKKEYPLDFQFVDGIATANVESFNYGEYRKTFETFTVRYRMTRKNTIPNTVILKVAVAPLASAGQSRAKFEYRFNFE